MTHFKSGVNELCTQCLRLETGFFLGISHYLGTKLHPMQLLLRKPGDEEDHPRSRIVHRWARVESAKRSRVQGKLTFRLIPMDCCDPWCEASRARVEARMQ